MVTTAQRYRVWNCDRCGGARAGDEPHYCQPVDSPLSAEQQEQIRRASAITQVELAALDAAVDYYRATVEAPPDMSVKDRAEVGLVTYVTFCEAVRRLIAVRGE